VVSARGRNVTLHTPVAELEGDLLIVRDARCVLVLRVVELVQFVKRERLAWGHALRFGKAWRRGVATAPPDAREGRDL
jgi:hypothetical protein